MMRGGDKAAFGVLFDRYYDLLHTFARHIIKDSSVAEDIIQNVFVKMWMRKEQVNPELSVRNYLLVATRNELFDYMRLRYNMLRSDINDAMLNVADGDTDIYDYVDVRERVGFIDSVMRSMPDKRREIFAMRYDRNMTNAEIARALNLSIRTVEKHVDLAIKQIRKTISVVTLFFCAVLLKTRRNLWIPRKICRVNSCLPTCGTTARKPRRSRCACGCGSG